MVLQAVCDHRMMFTDVYVGEVGSVHDARVFRRSPRFRSFRVEDFTNSTHLLADGAYPLSKHIIVPFRDNGHLTLQQGNFNFQHAKARNVIERAFALLKNRFRRLKYIDAEIENIPNVIVACCVLHNICLNNLDEVDTEIDEVSRVEEVEEAEGNQGVLSKNSFALGQAKRNLLMSELE